MFGAYYGLVPSISISTLLLGDFPAKTLISFPLTSPDNDKLEFWPSALNKENLAPLTDFIKLIGEPTGDIEILKLLLISKIVGNVNFSTLITFWETLRVFLCRVIPEIGLGTLSLRLSWTGTVTRLLSLER